MMNRPGGNPPSPNQGRPPDRGLRLGALFGINIYLDSSLIIIFALIVYILGSSLFPTWHPDWQASTNWGTAMAAGVLFFASVLAHELAHSLMARRFGIEVRRITLFLFGGLAEIQEEPREPRSEFFIAIVGPLTSIVLGILFSSIGASMAGAGFSELMTEDQAAALAGLSPAATLLLWLGPVNLMLGLFNMVPGFPLDGGRVLRALVWWLTGNVRLATQVASASGRFFGWFLMVLGAVQALSGAIMQGLWLVLIGWFLSNAASSSYKQLLVRNLLTGVTVRDVMRAKFESVGAHLPVADFIDNQLLQSPQLLWPVLEDDILIGLVTLEQVSGIPTPERAERTIGQVMRTDLAAHTLHPDTDAQQGLAILNTRNSPLAIVEDNRVIGLLAQSDAVKWLLLHQV
jgi:Zn-dependent protease/predicted transcriptional regulator